VLRVFRPEMAKWQFTLVWHFVATLTSAPLPHPTFPPHTYTIAPPSSHLYLPRHRVAYLSMSLHLFTLGYSSKCPTRGGWIWIQNGSPFSMFTNELGTGYRL